MRALTLALALVGGSCAAAHPQANDGALEPYVSGQFRADGPGGVVLIAPGAQPILRRAYGLADVERGTALRIDQPMPLGSLTKSFTAAAILRLADAGELALDDDVREHVPEALVGEHVVTLEQLLTHTSGIPSLVDVPGFFEWARQERSTEELLERTQGVPFLFEPGRSFSYSDSGYILLGAVLERRRNESWDRVVRALVAEPLGLTSVGSAGAPGRLAARGYEVVDGRAAPAASIDWSVPHASGSLAATVDDLLRWVRAWRGTEVASARLLEGAWSSRELPHGTRSGYGYGWKSCEFEGRVALQHGGWVPGFTASVLHLPEEDLTAICLTNADGGVEASYLARRALRLLLTGSAEPATVTLTPTQVRHLSGRYRSGSCATWTVSAADAGLYLDLGDGPIELAALSPSVLCAADSDGTWCFTCEAGQDGRAASIAMSLTCEPQARAWRVD